MEGGSWDDFANNLATDLAPLIVLFGEQVTKQYLSESVGFLDTVIFALAPLGILTAVVSAIRVSGSPSLRAFIGRAQEGPGNAEIELLSCKSETTAELWNDGGIARVFGKPRLLEIVVEEEDPDGHLVINFMCDAQDSWKERVYRHLEYHTRSSYGGSTTDSGRSSTSSGWSVTSSGESMMSRSDSSMSTGNSMSSSTVSMSYGVDPELRRSFLKSSPNLSLNKGIKKRPKLWFHATAILGTMLVSGVLIFAGISVYVIPNHFMKDGKPVERYSYPCFLIGTLGVNIGMFLCARVIEHATVELFYEPTAYKKGVVYWLQPGGQKVGDQVFNAFVGDFNKDESGGKRPYIKSIKNPKSPQDSLLWLAVGLTMTGFVLQFVGARGLHAAVTMALLGSTLIMAVIRAALRTQRMGDDDNLMRQPKLKNLPNNFSHGHEMDWFSLYLQDPSEDMTFRLVTDMSAQKLFKIGTGNQMAKCFQARVRLAALTGPEHLDWNDYPVRVTAWQLKRTLENVMNSLWSLPNRSRLKCELTWSIYVYCSKEKLSCADSVVGKSTLSLRRKTVESKWRVDVAELEAVLGLWTWSLVREQSTGNEAVHADSHLKQVRVLHEGTVGENFPISEMACWFPRGTLSWTHNRRTDIRTCFFTNTSRYSWSTRNYKIGRRVPSRLRGSSFMLCKEVKGSTLKMVAHEIFVSFLSSALANGKDITLNKALDDATEVLTRTEDGIETQVYVNKQIDAWAHHFESSDLGSRDEALMCILPVFYAQPQISRVHGGLKHVREQVEAYKREGRVEKANTMLNAILLSSGIDPVGGYATREYRMTVIELLGLNLHLARIAGFADFINGTSIITELRKFVCLTNESIFEKFLSCSWKAAEDSFGLDGDSREAYLSTNFPPVPSNDGVSILEKFLQLPNTGGRRPNSEVTRLALKWAAENDLGILFYLLLNKGDCLESRDLENMTYLMWASKEGHDDVVRLLLDENSECEAVDTENTLETPLMLAARYGHTKVLQLLIAKGADLNSQGRQGDTALLVAARNGIDDVIAVLVEAGSSLEIVNDVEETALLAAVGQKNSSGLSTLIEAGAKVNVQDLWGTTAFMKAASLENKDFALLLLDKGVSINSRNSKGDTALMEAARNRHKELAELLLHRGANPESKGQNSITALLIATQSHEQSIVQLLLDHGANIEAKDGKGRTALMIAAWGGEEGLVECLLERGAKLEARDGDSRTALMLAVLNGSINIVKLLLDRKADNKARDSEGKTALDFATKRSNGETLAVLEGRNAK